MKTIAYCLFLSLLLGTSLVSTSHAELEMIEVKEDAGILTIVFEDLAGITAGFTLQETEDLLLSFSDMPGIAPVLISGNRFRITVPIANIDRRFFQLTAQFIGDPLDRDGDGLPNVFESANGTDPDTFDTDGDRFSDGVEFAYGTDATAATGAGDVPDFTTFPRAEFAEALSESTEGSAGTHNVTVTFDQPYFGELSYTVVTSSTVIVGVDYTLPSPGSVTVSGSSVTIPITWIDDDQISPHRVLFLDIQTDPAQLYARGGQTRHTVLLHENDAWWSGLLAGKFSQRNFQLKLLRVGSTTTATFCSEPGNDGLPTLPGETVATGFSSQSVGIIPEGSFPATVQFDATNHFMITAAAIPAPTGGLLGPGTGLSRSLVIESLPASTTPDKPHAISSERIIGECIECLTLPGQPACVTQTNLVVLVKQLPASLEFAP